MSDVVFVDAWRMTNALLAAIAFLMIARNLVVKWDRRTPRMRLMSQAMLALLFLVVEGSIESIVRDIAPGLRTAFTTAACAWIVFALIATEDDYAERR